MSVLKVTCVSTDELGAERKISGIGGDEFYHSLDEAIRSINNRTHQYWTELAGESVWLTVAQDQGGRAFLTTDSDGSTPDDLLTLGACQQRFDGTSSGSEGDAETMLTSVGEFSKGSADEYAERLALRTVVRLLVLNRYGRDDARLVRNREDAIARACAAIDRLELAESASNELQESVKRHLEVLFAPPTQR
jgi:hypothetical protein